jgi:hypothetical protein
LSVTDFAGIDLIDLALVHKNDFVDVTGRH